ncbi:MAG: hypothetical protein HYY31_05585 [Chloroflexi bacterium]|nr:hypothetical protein [Chloroflexota bacterium]
MRQGRSKVPQPQTLKGIDAVCRHYWVIETPTGPVSEGICKLCGEQRKFKNYLDTTPYREDDPALSGANTKGRSRYEAPDLNLEPSTDE